MLHVCCAKTQAHVYHSLFHDLALSLLVLNRTLLYRHTSIDFSVCSHRSLCVSFLLIFLLQQTQKTQKEIRSPSKLQIKSWKLTRRSVHYWKMQYGRMYTIEIKSDTATHLVKFTWHFGVKCKCITAGAFKLHVQTANQTPDLFSLQNRTAWQVRSLSK